MPEDRPDLPFRHRLSPEVAEKIRSTPPAPSPPPGRRLPRHLRRRGHLAALASAAGVVDSSLTLSSPAWDAWADGGDDRP
jgi:hypothetical protein